MAETTKKTPEQVLDSIMCAAWNFNNKPHQLFSALMEAAKHFPFESGGAETTRLMDRAYHNIGAAKAVWSDRVEATPKVRHNHESPYDLSVGNKGLKGLKR